MTSKRIVKSKTAEQVAAPTNGTAAPASPKGLKIVAMQVENVKRVSFARLRPTGNMVIVSGENESGKSTVLDAIDYAITGTTNVPSQPIKRGHKQARIQVDLGEYLVERTFTQSSEGQLLTKLRVMSKDKAQFPSPQSLLDGFLGSISFDPLEFIRMDRKKQFETLRRLTGVSLDAIDQAKQEAYNARRDAGRDLDAAKARLKAMPPPPADLPEKLLDTAELTKKLEGAANRNSIIEAEKQKQRRKLEIAGDHDREVERLDRSIAEAYELIKKLNLQREEAQKAAAELRAEAEAMTFAEPIDTAATAEELRKAQATNQAIVQRNAYLAVEKEVEDLEARWTELDKTVKAKERERIEAIEKAAMPIPKLGFGDGEVLYDGLPFNQASNAVQIKVSVALAIASNPTLRVLRIKDGSLLDKKSLELVSSLANENDYQIWVERVEGAGPVSVLMEDGEAHGEIAESPEAKESALATPLKA